MSEKLEISVHCSFCSASHKKTVDLPDGWATRYGGVDEEHGFCPRHNLVSEFADSQCPGCVGGWGDCSLFDAFAYRELKLTEYDFSQLERGICPKRVNGTMMFSPKNGLEQVDIRDKPTVESGIAISKAIREYAATYHNKD